MRKIQLSILTPGIPERMGQIIRLQAKLQRQIGDLAVEHLVFCDNRRRAIGGKRQACLDMARGEYIAFLDDDDDVAECYVAAMLAAMERGPDVVTFRQTAIIDGLAGEVEFGVGNPNEPWRAGGVCLRAVWHVCGWRRDLAMQSKFPEESMYGEDWAWAEPLQPMIKSAAHIDRTLHMYRHDSKATAAPPPTGKVGWA